MIGSDTYTTRADDAPNFGPYLKNLILLNKFLTLEDNEAIDLDKDDSSYPNKFSDIIVRVTNSQQRDEHIFCHVKDITKNSDQTILWNDLLGSDRKSPFCLIELFDSYLKYSEKQATSSNVKELSIITNVGFTSNQSKTRSGFTLKNRVTVQYLLARHRRKKHQQIAHQPRTVKCCITQDDVTYYFEKKQDTSSLSGKYELYKFSPQGVQDVANFILTSKAVERKNRPELETFLTLLVFRVSVHIDDVNKVNQSLMKVFFPLHYDAANHEKSFDRLKETVLNLSKSIRWATIQVRRLIFDELTAEFKKQASLGSTKSYEVSVLTELFNRLNFGLIDRLDQISPWTDLFNDSSHYKSAPLPVVNIFSNESNATVITLKLFQTIRNLSLQRKSLIIQVSDVEGIKNVTEHFKQLNSGLSPHHKVKMERFYCVIEHIEEHTIGQLAEELSTLTELRQSIQFIIVTQHRIQKTNADLKSVQDVPLKWDDLPEAAQKHLHEKTLTIEGSQVTNLKALGLDKWAMDPSSLAQLITHDEKQPLCLCLPKYDSYLDILYVQRQLKLAQATESHEIDESQLLEEDVTNKLVMIVDQPGSGKTFLLTSLENQFIKEQNNKVLLDRLMLRVNLAEVESMWENSAIIHDEMTAVNFLVNHLAFKKKESENPLSNALIKQMCFHSSVFLLFDGLDALSDEKQRSVLKLIHHLLSATGLKRVILTSRPDNALEKTLEEHFKQSAFHLKTFDDNQQIQYLVKHWNAKLQVERRVPESNESVGYFSEKFVEHLQKRFQDEDTSLLDTPLQCTIVCECFFDELISYLEKCPSVLNLPTFQDEHFELLHIYQRFIKTRMDISYEETAQLPSDENDAMLSKSDYETNCSNSMITLSVFYFMKYIDDAQVLYRTPWKTYRNSKYPKDLEQARRLGLIHYPVRDIDEHLDGPQFKFIHHTFGEYFFAMFLLNSFTRPECELLDDAFFRYSHIRQRIIFKIITDKIPVSTDYTGIRRFFDRMIMNHIPLAADQRPFAVEDQAGVSSDCPVISDEKFKFNRFLAASLTSHFSEMFEKWTKNEIDKLNSNEILEGNISALRTNVKDKQTVPLVDMLIGKSQVPFVTMLVISCLKEYANSSRVSDDEREALAFSLTLTSLMWMSEGGSTSEVSQRVTNLYLQWFDPAKELPAEQNHVFSKWFFKIVNKLTDGTLGISSLAALGGACSRMIHHRHATDFKVKLEKIAKTVFNEQRSTIANDYFEVRPSCGHLDNVDAHSLQEKARYFLGVLSLSTAISPDSSVLNLQVEWFLSQLAKDLESKKQLLETLQTTPETLGNGDLQEKDVSDLNYKNIYTFVETLEFFLSTSDLDETSTSVRTEMRATLLDSALDFYCTALLFFLEFPLALDLIWGSIEGNDVYRNTKDETVSGLLWYLVMSDRIVPYLSDPQRKREDFVKVVSCITRRAMIAYTSAGCCQSDDIEEPPGLIIYFPRHMYTSLATRKRFDAWLKDWLNTVWEERGELELIEFLFNDEIKLPVECPKQDESDLRALPCLLFSDVVSSYIPDKLSQKGLKHLMEKMKCINFPGNELSLWDGTDRENSSVEASLCKHQDQIRVLRKKIEERNEV